MPAFLFFYLAVLMGAKVCLKNMIVIFTNKYYIKVLKFEMGMKAIEKSFLFLFLLMLLIQCEKRAYPLRETRGIWMSRFDYTYFRKTHNPDSIRGYIYKTFQEAKEANFNAVFFQARGNADAFYDSKYEPWSSLLSGKLGKNPGWDPLAFAVETAHEMGLELHVWFNTFPAWRGKKPPSNSTPVHPLIQHPDWLVCDRYGKPMKLTSGYVSFSPGIPAVQEHLLRVIEDIITKYDVDGIHFDYIRYPEAANARGYSHDKISLERFGSERGNPLGLNWDDWQREQITTFVAKAYNLVKDIKPWIRVSAAVIGRYNRSSWNAYNIVYQDPRRWMELDKIDFLVPMMYLDVKTFETAIKEWKEIIPFSSSVLAGIGLYRLDIREAIEQVRLTRKYNLGGFVVFSSTSLNGKWDVLRKNLLRYPSLSSGGFVDSVHVSPPGKFSVFSKEDSIYFMWCHPSKISEGGVKSFLVLFSPTPEITLESPENILAVVPGNLNGFESKFRSVYKRAYFSICTVDRFNNVSIPAKPVKLKKEMRRP